MPENTPPTDAQVDHRAQAEALLGGDWYLPHAVPQLLEALTHALLAAGPVAAATHTDTAAQAGAQALRDEVGGLLARWGDYEARTRALSQHGMSPVHKMNAREANTWNVARSELRTVLDDLAAQAPAPTPGRDA